MGTTEVMDSLAIACGGGAASRVYETGRRHRRRLQDAGVIHTQE